MDARVTAQELYIKDLEHCVRELQRIVDRFRSSAVASAGLLPDDLCDVLVPHAPSLRAPASDVTGLHTSPGTPAPTGTVTIIAY